MTPTVLGNLYHRPATPVRGDAILPLNALRHRHPDLYDLHRSRYETTPDVLTQKVEALGCTWSDVVFLSPVHPAPQFDALRRSGKAAPDREPWILPAARLDPSRTVIRLMRAGADGHTPDACRADDFLPFTTATLRAVNRVSIDAVQRLESLGPGDPWLPWVDVPHVLHRGPIPLAWFTFTPA
jgi:hypothetical protein